MRRLALLASTILLQATSAQATGWSVFGGSATVTPAQLQAAMPSVALDQGRITYQGTATPAGTLIGQVGPLATGALQKNNNLSDLANPAAALNNLGALPTSAAGAANGYATLDNTKHLTVTQIPFGTAGGTVADGGTLATALSNVSNAIPRSMIGAASGVAALDGNRLVPSAQLPIGTGANQVAAGNDVRITGAAPATNAVLTGPTLSADPATGDASKAVADTNWVTALVKASGGTATTVGQGTDLSGGNITPTNGSATPAPQVAAAALSALPQAATKSVPEVGQMDFEGSGQMIYHGNNSFTWGGIPWMVEGGSFIGGFGTYSDPMAYFGYAEAIKDSAELDTFNISDTMVNGARGARNNIISNMQINGQLGDASPIIAMTSHAYNTGTMPTPAADGWPVGWSTTGGGMQGVWNNMSDNPPTGRAASGMSEMANSEIDSGFPANAMVSVHYGSNVVDQGTYAATQFSGVTRHGLNDDIGYDIQGPSWQTLYGAGSRVNGWSNNPETTLFKVFQREYGGPPAPTFVARDGFDTRGMTFLGSAWASNGVAINSAGAVSAKTIETGAGVQALTATVSGATVVEGGEYYGFPGYSVDAPPLGGTTATVTTSAMALLNIGRFGSTGAGYAVGDVLTAGTGLVIPLSGGTATADVGLTGTPFQFTVDAINTFGGITGGHFSNNGAITDVPNDHLITLTGGKGTGAVIFVNYGEVPSYVNNQPVYSQYRLVPNGWSPGASGAGFKPGDTFGPSGDTGTEGSLKVGTVTPTGAVLMQALSLVSGGSVSAVGGASPRTFTTSGSGTNLDALFGYAVKAVTTTPGSGYLADQQPVVTPNQSDFVNAKVRLTMAPAPASLALNPQGGDVSVSNGNLIVGPGKIYLDGGKNEWVQEINGKVVIGTGTTNLFSIDGSGNVVARGTVTQNGTP